MAKVGLVTGLTKSATALLRYVTGTDIAASDKRALDVWVQGGEVIDVGGLMDGAVYDYVAVTYPSTTQEVYTFKLGGSGGTTVATVTLNYVDSSKASLLNAART